MKSLMSKLVFIDSNFFIGLYVPTNSLHEQCISLGKKYQNYDLRPCISNYVVSEVLTVLRLKSQQRVVDQVNREFVSGRFKIFHHTQKLDQRALRWFMDDKRQKLSFVDASIITTMQHEGIKILVTFDEHLAKVARGQGFKVLVVGN